MDTQQIIDALNKSAIGWIVQSQFWKEVCTDLRRVVHHQFRLLLGEDSGI